MVRKKCDRCDSDPGDDPLYLAHDKVACLECAKDCVKCDDCGYYVHKNTTTEVEDKTICAECLSNDYSKCNKCNAVVRNAKFVFTKEGGETCDTCLSEFYKECHYCGEHFLYGDSKRGGNIFYVESIEDYACTKCMDRHMSTCVSCEELFPTGECTIVGGEYYCEECAKMAAHCFMCGGSVGDSVHRSEWICRKCFKIVVSNAYMYVSADKVLAVYPDLKKRISNMFERSVVNRGEIAGLSQAISKVDSLFRNMVYIDFSTLKFKEKNGTRKGDLSDLGSPRNYFNRQLDFREKTENINAHIDHIQQDA
jgi:hypothetical protein